MVNFEPLLGQAILHSSIFHLLQTRIFSSHCLLLLQIQRAPVRLLVFGVRGSRFGALGVFIWPADQEEAFNDIVASGGHSRDGGEAGRQRGRVAGVSLARAVVDPRLRCGGGGGGELQTVSVGDGEQLGRQLELGWWRVAGASELAIFERWGCRISIH
jgi:hypothetical protein